MTCIATTTKGHPCKQKGLYDGFCNLHKFVKPLIVSWKGIEHLKTELIVAANKVKQTGDQLKHYNNAQYLHNVTSGVRAPGLSPHSFDPAFTSHNKAFNEFNDLKRKLCCEYGLSINLIRTVSEPILGDKNPELLWENLEMDREEALRQKKINSRLHQK